MAQPKVELLHISKSFPAPGRRKPANEVLAGLNLAAEKGSFVVFVGPSGCGKTTLLRLVAGFESPTSGEVRIDGNVVKSIQHNIGMLFQAYSLYPWLTVRDNIRFGLRVSLKYRDKREQQETVDQMLKLVRLEEFEAAYPSTLSGGMRQRVALARSLVTHPSLLLLDEPFGALDAQTRMVLQDQLVDLWQDLDTTVFAVTHDIEEALLLADVIHVLSARPANIIETIENPFAHPRSPSLRSDPRFIKKKMELFELMRDATVMAMRGTGATVVELREHST